MPSFTMNPLAPIVLSRSGALSLTGDEARVIIRGLVFTQAKYYLSNTSALTNSSGGVAESLFRLLPAVAAASSAASGTNLADKTTTEAALLTVLNALATIYVKANAAAVALGIAQITYNGGGTNGAGTVAAVTQSVSATATGVPTIAFNAALVAINTAIANLMMLVDKIAIATGIAPLNPVLSIVAPPLVATPWRDTYLATIPAVVIATGTAVAALAVLATDANAALVVWTNDVATISVRLNAALAGPTVAPVIVQ